MFYVDPKIQDKFNSLSDDLKSAIRDKDAELHSFSDLMRVLEDMAKEG